MKVLGKAGIGKRKVQGRMLRGEGRGMVGGGGLKGIASSSRS